MTKKHFIELADMVKDIKPSSTTFMAGIELDAANSQWLRTRNRLSEFCASQNPRFDRALWMDYIDGKCGPNGGKI